MQNVVLPITKLLTQQIENAKLSNDCVANFNFKRKEKDWLLKHVEFSMIATNIKEAMHTLDFMKDKGYNCVLWSKDHIHPELKHGGLSIISIYAKLNQKSKIIKDAKTVGLTLFSVKQYIFSNLHPLKSISPIDILFTQTPISLPINADSIKNLCEYKLYDLNTYLGHNSNSQKVKENAIFAIFLLFPYLSTLYEARALLYKNGIKDVLTFPEPKLEYKNFDDSILLVYVPLNKISLVLELISESYRRRCFIGELENAKHLSSSVIFKY